MNSEIQFCETVHYEVHLRNAPKGVIPLEKPPPLIGTHIIISLVGAIVVLATYNSVIYTERTGVPATEKPAVHKSSPVIFSSDYIFDYLVGHNMQIPLSELRSRHGDVTRNASGTAIHVSTRDYIWKIAADHEVTRMSKPGRIAVIDQSGNFVAWTSHVRDEGVHFSCGTHIPPGKWDTIRFDPSATYFCLMKQGPPWGMAEIRRTDNPHRVLAETKLLCRKLFLRENTLYFFGYADYNTLGPICQIFRIEGESLTGPHENIELKPPVLFRSVHVIDMDPFSQRVLLQAIADVKMQFLPSFWYVYDLETQRIEPHDRLVPVRQLLEPKWGIFLAEDILDCRNPGTDYGLEED